MQPNFSDHKHPQILKNKRSIQTINCNQKTPGRAPTNHSNQMLDIFNMPLRKKKPLSLCGYFSPELRHTPKSDQLPQAQATSVTGIDQVTNKIAHSDQLSKNSILKKTPTSHPHRFDLFNLGCRLICKPKSDNRPEAPPSTTIAKDEAYQKDTDTTKVTKRVTFGVPSQGPPSTTMAKDKAGGEDRGTRKVARPKVTFDVIYEEDEDNERVRAPRRRETHPNIRELNRGQATSPSA
ncbi:hypothetical protein FPQ18DRAFT_305833 [Pyronema domesticum]|nr:hypothetical protein FPQ18DRAFT_305833 [Pyronema domesticum]